MDFKRSLRSGSSRLPRAVSFLGALLMIVLASFTGRPGKAFACGTIAGWAQIYFSSVDPGTRLSGLSGLLCVTPVPRTLGNQDASILLAVLEDADAQPFAALHELADRVRLRYQVHIPSPPPPATNPRDKSAAAPGRSGISGVQVVSNSGDVTEVERGDGKRFKIRQSGRLLLESADATGALRNAQKTTAQTDDPQFLRYRVEFTVQGADGAPVAVNVEGRSAEGSSGGECLAAVVGWKSMLEQALGEVATLIGVYERLKVDNPRGEVVYDGPTLRLESGEQYLLNLPESIKTNDSRFLNRKVKVTGHMKAGNPMAQFDPTRVYVTEIELTE